MTNFTWNNGTELKPVPLTNSQAHKFAEIIRDQNINKSISGVICFLEEPDIEDELTLSGQLNLQIVRAYTDEDEMKNIPVTITGVNPFTITSTLVSLGNFVCPEGITEEDGAITITNDYIPNEESLEFITFRMCSGRNFPLGGIPINLNDFFNASESSDDSNLDDEDYSYLMTNFTSNPVVVNKFIKYPRLAEIFRRHLDLFDFIYKVNPEELITFFTVSEETINGYASEGTFDRLKTYLKTGHNYEFIKFINDAPCYYTNIFVNTGWTNLAVYKNLVCVDNSIPRIDMSEYDMPTIFRGNITGYSGSNSKNPLVDGTITSPLALTAFSARKISNGSATADGIPDGMSLAHLLCSTDAANAVTEIVDDNTGWDLTQGKLPSLHTLLPNIKRLFIQGKATELSGGAINGWSELEELNAPKIGKLRRYDSSSAAIVGCSKLRVVDMQSVNEVYANGAPDYPCIHNCAALEKVKLGTITVRFANLVWEASSANLLDIELGQGSNVSINLARWAPTLTEANTATFLQNFKEHICQRLADRTGKSKLTLTLSAAVYSAIGFSDNTIVDTEDVRYQIKQELLNRNWKVTDGTNTFNG